MMLPMSLVKGMDIVGSSLLIILSIYALRLMCNIYRRNQEVALYSYLFAQTIALAVFAISRSVGHIMKHILITAGLGDIWNALSPISGSINSLTFVVFGLFAFMYSNVRTTAERVDDLERRRRELKASEGRLRDALVTAESERAKTEAVIAAIGDGISIQSRDYRIIYENEVQKELMGNHIGEICYRGYDGRDSICDNCPVEQAFMTGRVHSSERRVIQNEEVRYFDITASPLRDATGEIVQAIEVVRDVTERKKLEAQLLQSQKMEAIGTLTGGIAHDFNNMLTAIIGYGELLRDDIQPESHLKKYVDMILSSAEKSAALTQSLLTFSRKQIMNLAPTDINRIVRDVEKLISRLIGEDIEIRLDLTESPLILNADSGQIEQVFMNLATNARDAMPKGGTFTVSTKAVDLDEHFMESHPIGEPGHYVLVTVSDTGVGMDEHIRDQIFQPYFSTKEVGKGTGLGLAVVYGIIKQHGGGIFVYSEPGQGTTFKIYFPLLYMEGTKPEEIEVAPPVQGGTETVLVAEDEEPVRDLLRNILDRYGYQIIEAVDGQEAVAQFLKHKDEIHILLLDVMMPNKNGVEAYREIQAMLPDVKAIFLSGYPSDFLNTRGVTDKTFNYVAKPISPMELLRRIREVLDA